MHQFKSYKKIDQAIYSLKQKIDYINFINPTNSQQEKARFFANFYQGKVYNPKFVYHKPSTAVVKKLLNQVDQLSVPSDNKILKKIYTHELRDLNHRINLIGSIGSRTLTQSAQKVFGPLSGKLKLLAHKKIYRTEVILPNNHGHFLNQQQALKLMKKALLKAGITDWQVKINNPGAPSSALSLQKMVSLQHQEKYDPVTFKILVNHEILGHAQQAHNSSKLGLKIFELGFGRYELIDEGHALYREQPVNPHIWNRLYIYYLAVDYALKHSLYQTFCYLTQWLNIENSYYMAARVKRGLADTSRPGSFIKDKVYLEALTLIKSYSKHNLSLVKKARFDYRFIGQVDKLLINISK